MPHITSLIDALYQETTALQQQVSSTFVQEDLKDLLSEISSVVDTLENLKADFLKVPIRFHNYLEIITSEQQDALNQFLSQHRFDKKFAKGFWGYLFLPEEEDLLRPVLRTSLEKIDTYYAQLCTISSFFILYPEDVELLEQENYFSSGLEQQNVLCQAIYNLERSIWSLQYLSYIEGNDTYFLLPQFLLQRQLIKKKLSKKSAEDLKIYYNELYQQSYQEIQKSAEEGNYTALKLQALFLLDGCVYLGEFSIDHETDIGGGRAKLLALDQMLISQHQRYDEKIALLIAKSYYNYEHEQKMMEEAIVWLDQAYLRGAKNEATYYLTIFYQYGIVREGVIFLQPGSEVTKAVLTKHKIPVPQFREIESEKRGKLDWITQWFAESKRLSQQTIRIPDVVLTLPTGGSYKIKIDDGGDPAGPYEIVDESPFKPMSSQDRPLSPFL